MKNPISDSHSSLPDANSIWASYRRAAMRTGQAVNLNIDRSREPSANVRNRSAPMRDVHDSLPTPEVSLTVERLKAEVKRLKRVIQKKDLVIDMLMERVVKLQRNQPNERSSSSSNQDVLSSSATSLDVSNGGDSVICTQQSPGTSTPTETVGRPTTVASTVQSSKAATRSRTFVIHKGSKFTIQKKDNETTTTARYSAVLDIDTECTSASSQTFTVPRPFGELYLTRTEERGLPRRLAEVLPRAKPSRTTSEASKQRVFPIDRNVFVIEGLSARTEDNHPDWKAPLPPSLCLTSNRPELIRRIEHRQAAISAATALRRRIAEEKMGAARAVVQGKCSFSHAKHSLFLDPTRITAFPKEEIINLTKKHLRASNAYKSEISGEKDRVDVAASKIIAQSFSEATRQAVLAGRTSTKY